MNREAAKEWAGKNVLVLGLAKSGLAVARLLHRLGAKVQVNEQKPEADCPEAETLRREGIPSFFGSHPLELVNAHLDVVIKNPGIPYSAAPVQKALQLGVPVYTEVEVAGRLTEAKIVGITGSNGKTTTTTLVGEMLRASRSVQVVGNIGTALSEVAPDASQSETLVVELSSFQLKGTETFRPQVAALLNVYNAHLDYHGEMLDYVASKQRLFANQQEGDTAVLNADCPYCRATAESLRAQVWWFSSLRPVERGVFLEDGRFWLRSPGKEPKAFFSLQELKLKGKHNWENALAASAIALAAGASFTDVAQALRGFGGVEHRLEYVATVGGVSYYNDSKATNPDAAMRALEAFDGPITWIAGGLNRELSFAPLLPVVQKRVRRVIGMGETAEQVLQLCKEAGISERFFVQNVEEAVWLARRVTLPSETVLLSPACASWDQYRSYEERGNIFKATVHRLV